MTDQQKFEEACKPLIKYMAENCHPHKRVIVDSNSAMMLEGIMNFRTGEYLRD